MHLSSPTFTTEASSSLQVDAWDSITARRPIIRTALHAPPGRLFYHHNASKENNTCPKMPPSCDRNRVWVFTSRGPHQGFQFRLTKNFGHGRNQRISWNFAKFRPRFSFRLFLKIFLNIFKLLFPKFLNFGGGRNQRISRNFAEILDTGPHTIAWAVTRCGGFHSDASWKGRGAHICVL